MSLATRQYAAAWKREHRAMVGREKRERKGERERERERETERCVYIYKHILKSEPYTHYT